MVKINADPYAITPEILAQYQATYGSAPPPAAINQYNQENSNYYAGDPNATGSIAGSGLPSAVTQNPLSSWLAPLSAFSGNSPTGELDAATAFASNNPIGQGISAAGGAVSSVGAALNFITDIPRVITTLLGIILIIAGIFSLTRSSPIAIVQAAAQNRRENAHAVLGGIGS